MTKMRSITPNEIETKDLHQYILGAIAPRPIAFASTIDENGVANIAPYSFFNAFSSNPPILVFSSNRTVENNTTKDTLHNLQKNGEVVINVVNYNIVRQMAIASISYPLEISEFEKSGLSPIPSDLVKPFRIKESPVQFECKVQDIITLGEHGGAGHLIICKVLKVHIDEAVIDERDRIDPDKIDLVGRMGRAYYVRASGNAVFSLHQSPSEIALGFDQLPEHIRKSPYLSGNEIASIACQLSFPTEEQIQAAALDAQNIVKAHAPNSEELRAALHGLAKELIEKEDYVKAFATVLLFK